MMISKNYFPVQLKIDAVVILGSLARGGSDYAKRLVDVSTVPVMFECNFGIIFGFRC